MMEYSCGERIIRAVGRSGEVNDSSIWTRLVQEAGRKCDAYASDILLDWQMWKRELKSALENNEDCVWLFGFRGSGVDHTEWVEQHTRDYGYYISVFELSLAISHDGSFELSLARIC